MATSFCVIVYKVGFYATHLAHENGHTGVQNGLSMYKVSHLFTNLVQAVRLEAVAGAGQQEGINKEPRCR